MEDPEGKLKWRCLIGGSRRETEAAVPDWKMQKEDPVQSDEVAEKLKCWLEHSDV